MRCCNVSLVSICLIWFCASAPSQQRRAITPDDAYALSNVSDPQISVDGKDVVYVLTTIDRERDRRVSSIWIAPVDGSRPPIKFVGMAPAKSPRWSPDGKWLAFLCAGKSAAARTAKDSSTQNEAPESAVKTTSHPQIWLVSRDGKSPRQITGFENGVTAFDWSPGSDKVVAVSRSLGSDQSPPSSDVRAYTSIAYKLNGEGWFGQARGHLWIVPVDVGEPRQITSGDDWQDSAPVWSPDGKEIAFVREDLGDRLRVPFESGAIQVISASGGDPHPVTTGPASVHSPVWSPDSQSIAYIATSHTNEEPLLFVTSAAGGAPAKLADDLDSFPTEVHWTSDGTLWFGATDHGTAHFYKMAPGSKHAVLVIGGKRAVHEVTFSLNADEIVFMANDSLHPPALYAADLSDGREHQLTFHNQALLEQLDIDKVEELNFKGADGWPIQGFFMKPRGWQPTGNYPMILSIHGGPNGMFGDLWEMDLQLYAAQGWAVLFINPRGSSGYGMRFQRAVAGQWGGAPYVDLMDGVDAALAKYPWIDRNRLGVVGWSYGGFMTDWLITQTHRFKAAISIAGISDLQSVEGTRDYAYGHARDFAGDLFTNPELYRKYSAIFHANAVTTPTLFLQGEADQRVPESQSEEYFRALKHFGVPAELVLFPREDHMLPVAAEPKHLVESYQWRLKWFERYLGPPPN